MATFESNIAYVLRFMIDAKVSHDHINVFHSPISISDVEIGCWNELDRTSGW